MTLRFNFVLATYYMMTPQARQNLNGKDEVFRSKNFHLERNLIFQMKKVYLDVSYVLSYHFSSPFQSMVRHSL